MGDWRLGYGGLEAEEHVGLRYGELGATVWGIGGWGIGSQGVGDWALWYEEYGGSLGDWGLGNRGLGGGWGWV